MKRRLRYLAIVIGVAAIGVIWLALRWDYIRIRPVNRAAEQDAVYEAVMRYVAPNKRVKQVVFDQRVESGNWDGKNYGQCASFMEDELKRTAEVRNKPRNSNQIQRKNASIYDWLYEVLYGWNDSPVRPETINEFVQTYCTPGDLSQAFRTDQPRAFVDGDEFQIGKGFDNDPREKLDHHFAGAYGMTSLSHVGFDTNFREAVVGWSFECGMLCGVRNVFHLRKVRGRWTVVETLQFSVS